MNLITKAYLVQHALRWYLTAGRRNTNYRYTVPGNPKFMSALEAVRQFVRDGDVIGCTGLAGNQRASILYFALRELYEKTGHPAGLDVLAIGGIGGRGRLAGTLEELARPGLVKRLISAHLETFKEFLKLADQGKLELQCLPQGILAMLIDGQARGEESLSLKTGTGTFMDPRVGRGSPLTQGAEQWVTAVNSHLTYQIPKIDVALFNAPAADREGNIYVKNAAMIGESRELALAARRNHGKVIVNVGVIVPKGHSDVFLPADYVDAVVMYPRTEQTGTIQHRRYWSMFTTHSKVKLDEAIARARFVNGVLGITPRRTAADQVLARLATSILAENAHKGAYVNIGVGLPEEVCRLMYEGGLLSQVTLLTESGVLGGLPAPGIFFGAAACPERIISSSEIFKLCYERLDVTVLGMLQADSAGNVNVSKRGDGAINYVGPGGFIDLTTAAKMVVFAGSWMAQGQMAVENGQVRVVKPGKPKFVEHVDEITFNGQEALKAGKRVFYVTHTGAFRLTERGMELYRVLPGIDIQRDIINACPMKILLPESGTVPVADCSIVTGKGFNLAFQA